MFSAGSVLVLPCLRRLKFSLAAKPLLQIACAPHANVQMLSLLQVLEDTHALLLNGCVFDELPAEVVLEAARGVRAAGGAVFFDPGAPRAQASRLIYTPGWIPQ